MSTILFLLSIVLLITAFGIHSMLNDPSNLDQPMYLSSPLAAIPWISGFILPLVPLSFLFDYHWLALAIVNLGFVLLAGRLITKAYLVRLSTGILGKDMIYSFGLGLLALLIGVLLK